MPDKTQTQPERHRPLTDLDDALVFLEEIEFAMRHAPIKRHDRTQAEQEAVERYTTYWVWIRDVLRSAGIAAYQPPDSDHPSA